MVTFKTKDLWNAGARLHFMVRWLPECNGGSDRKHWGFRLTECLSIAEWGKGVTEWNEQNNFGA